MENEMNITSASHARDERTNANRGYSIVIDGEEMFVPLAPANRHYAEIMRQVEAGELTIEDAD